MAIVEFQNVSRVYHSGDHELRALDGVNMKLDEGKFVVILGPSGAGKSTLLNILGGLDSPTDGKVLVGGKDISTLSGDELAEYRAETVGFAYISPVLYENATGMAFYPQLHIISDMEKADFTEAADKALGKTSLILTKNEVISYAQAEGEATEGKTMGLASLSHGLL